MKNILVLLGAMLLSTALSAQVKFNLSYEESTHVYTVSVVPEVTWEAPKNMLNSAQIVLRVDANVEFTPGITSLVSGLTWADNAYVERPAGAPDHTFVCISLVNGPTSQISLQEGETVPLFSFVNSGGGCAGLVTLLNNDDPMVQSVRSAGFNVTQHFALLGARGNAYAGAINAEVDCSSVTGTEEQSGKIVDGVKIAPVPADKTVSIQWTMQKQLQSVQEMVICDAQGREVFREKVEQGMGVHTRQISVEHWQAGLYRVRFVFANAQQTQSWNLMVVH